MSEKHNKKESFFNETQKEFQEKLDESKEKIRFTSTGLVNVIEKGSKAIYLEYQHDLLSKCVDLAQRKNADYTGASDDAFANFRNSEVVGVSVEKGMLVRLMDKISRVKSFIDKGELMVKDESVEDTIMDIINYACLLGGYINETKDGNTIY